MIAGARSGKTSTALKPNLLLYWGSMLVLDPKGKFVRETAIIRAALGHRIHVLDPFGQSGGPSARFNVLAELDPASTLIIDDVAIVAQAVIVDDGDSRSQQHWNTSARAFLTGVILFTLTLPPAGRHMVVVRQFITLPHPALRSALQGTAPDPGGCAGP